MDVVISGVQGEDHEIVLDVFKNTNGQWARGEIGIGRREDKFNSDRDHRHDRDHSDRNRRMSGDDRHRPSDRPKSENAGSRPSEFATGANRVEPGEKEEEEKNAKV